MNITLCYISPKMSAGGLFWSRTWHRPRLAQVEPAYMVTLRIIPDRTVDNRANFKLIRALHEFYAAPLGRLSFRRWLISYRPKERFWYDILVSKDEIKFYFTVPGRWETYARQKIQNTWPRAAIEAVDPQELAIPLEDTRAAELVYKRHNIFALHCDRTEDTVPLGAVLAASRDMAEGDLARLSICADPLHRLNWQDQAEQAHGQFNKGKTPQRRGLSKKKALLSVGTTLEGIFPAAGRGGAYGAGTCRGRQKARAGHGKAADPN